MKYSILFFSLLLTAQSAFAGHTEAGEINNLHFMKNGVVAFSSNGNRVNLTTDQQCVLSQPGTWALDASTDTGKAQLSGLLLAYAANKKIVIHGTGNCDPTVHSDRETVNYFYTVP